MNSKSYVKIMRYMYKTSECRGERALYSLYKNPSDRKRKVFENLVDNVPVRLRDSIRVWGNYFNFVFGYVEDGTLHIRTKYRWCKIEMREEQ